jgi:hypothetical protein
MRFIVMHKQSTESEAGVPPSPELIAAMGKFMGEAMRTGVLLSGEGLQPSSHRARLKFSGGVRTVTHAPFTGSNELAAGLTMLKVRSQEEAIFWASRIAEAVGDVELEVGQIKEPWDVGLCPRPEDAPMRFLVLEKAGLSPSPKVMAALKKVAEGMRKAGVFLSAERLQRSSKGTRLRFSRGKHTVIDGPFAESKELIGGFAMLQVKSKEEAIAWAIGFAKVLYEADVTGNLEVDVLQVVVEE